MKIEKHIEIVRTSRARYSSMSGIAAQRIQAVLGQQYEQVGISLVDTAADLEILVRKRPDLVFLGLKKLPPPAQKPGRHTSKNQKQTPDVWLSEYLDQHGINYTGSSKAATRLDYDKAAAKRRVHAAGLSTAAFFTSLPGQHAGIRDLPLAFPLFVKPLNIGGGQGIDDDSVVRNFPAFQRKVAAISDQFGSTSLVECYLTGREFSVAILGDTTCAEPAVMPIEIITAANTHGDRVLGSRIKHEDNEQVIAINEPGVKAQISAFAKAVYDLLGGRDLARIDIRMDAAGEAQFLEVNFMPAPRTRYFAGACRINKGMDYESVILAITKLGLLRGTTAALALA